MGLMALGLKKKMAADRGHDSGRPELGRYLLALRSDRPASWAGGLALFAASSNRAVNCFRFSAPFRPLS
jgi:hypothetical protein